MLGVGAPAPDPPRPMAHNGEKVKLSDLRGKPVVVYFYPKGQHAGLHGGGAGDSRSLERRSRRTQAVVIGVSTDDEASHQAFA